MEIIAGGILLNSQKELDSLIEFYGKALTWWHLDFFDGNFFERKSMLFDYSLPKTLKLEAHIGLKNGLKLLKKAQVHRALFHVELAGLDEVRQARGLAEEVGLIVSPGISWQAAAEYLPFIDCISFSTVKRMGYVGEEFNPEVIGKIRKLRELAPDMVFGADGGISPHTIGEVARSGVTRFVVGKYLLCSNRLEDSLQALSEAYSAAIHR
jgi:ribulose-phosphate 3-epimerase